MDAGHLHALSILRPKNSKAHLALFLEYVDMGITDVPDPYYGGSKDFDACVDLVEEACKKLITKIAP
jgi:protein-tyrosine phosphatase